jgi:predicted RND superfamily exporter protein
VIGGVVALFLIGPTIGIVEDKSGRSFFGRMQYSVMTFSAPILYTVCTTVVGCGLMFACDIVLLTPFAILQLVSVGFAVVLGLFGIPAGLALISGRSVTHQRLPGEDAVLAK